MSKQIILVPMIIACIALFARAQDRTPFFDRAGTAFDPEIAIVNTGAVADMQATVSADNRYVTINARPSVSRLIAVREFAFQSSSNVGTVRSLGGENARINSVLDRPGMTRLGNP